MKFSKSRTPILLMSLVLLFGTSVTAQSCNCAAFRLDSVQDYWLTNVQQAVMQAFIDTNTPLTVGVSADNFGQDLPHVYFMRDQTVRNPTTPLEIACNGLGSEDWTTMDLATQTQILARATREIEEFLWVPPIKVFIPPTGRYNTDTLTAMRSRNMTHISTFTSLDSVRPYALTNQTVYRFPSAAALSLASNPSVGISAQTAYSQVSIGIARDGFSVVQLSLEAFAQKSNGESIDVVNATMISELKNLLTMTRSGGYSIVPISKINLDAPTTKAPVNYTDIYSCNCVSFRLDDVQDFYMSTQQYSIMNAFLDNQVGVTLGVIANLFGADTELVNFVKSKASVPTNNFEIANHGLNHEDFSTFTESAAISTLTQAQNIIQSATGVRPTTLILPYNAFNNETLDAIKTVGFTRFSSSMDVDPAPYDFSSPDLWHLPAGSQTSNPDIEDYFEYSPATVVLEDIKMQLDRDGFAVVMMHPQEFSNRAADNSYTQALNQTAMNDFVTLLQSIKAAGIRIVPMSSISSYMTQVTGSNQPNPSASPAAASPSPAAASPSPAVSPSPVAVSPSPAAASPSPAAASPSPATSQLPSFSPIPSGQTSASPAASRQPSATPARESPANEQSSSSVKVQPLGAVSILALIIAAVMGAQ